MNDEDEGAFPAGPDVPGQAASRDAYQRFLANSGLAKEAALRAELAAAGIWSNQGEPPAWLATYLQLRAEGWDWRKAAFIAWSACPTGKRWPKTIAELAITVLGLKSDRAVRGWREKDPRIEERIGKLLMAEMMDHRQDAIAAMIAVASTADSSGFNDRKMLLQITGILKDRKEISGPEGGPIPVHLEFEHLSDEELERAIRNLQATADRAG